MAPQCAEVSSQTRCCFETPSAAFHALHQTASRAECRLLPPLFSLCVLVYRAPRTSAHSSSFRRHYVNFCTLNGRLDGISLCGLRPRERLAHGSSTQPLGQQLGAGPALRSFACCHECSSTSLDLLSRFWKCISCSPPGSLLVVRSNAPP